MRPHFVQFYVEHKMKALLNWLLKGTSFRELGSLHKSCDHGL